MSSTKMMHSTNESFARSQQTGLMMIFTMAAALVVFTVVVATSLPVSKGLKLAPMDADEVAAQVSDR